MARSRQPRALIVDDNADDRTLICRALEREAFQCETASDGIMAENMLRSREYDVVVSDLRMPRKHGHQLIVELLNRQNPPLVVAVTGLAEPKLVADLLGRGVADVVQKPVSYPMLAAKIRTLLELHTGESTTADTDANRVADSISVTTESLRQQLAQVTETFQSTIDRLEKQKSQLQEEFMDSLRVLSNLIGSAGDRQQSHVGRVEILSEQMGRHLGLHSDQLHMLKFAALLHDIGQFGMPDKLRNKPPWALSEEELEIFGNYPLVGAAILSEVRGAESASEIIEAHCENFDGSGFPRGLAGKEIPFEARILRVADGCDLFRMHSENEDLLSGLRDHLLSEKGRAYDPGLVGVAISCLGQAYEPRNSADLQQCLVSKLLPGQVLAENVYDEHGHFLARQGATLSVQMIERLKKLLRGQQISVKK